MSRNKIEHLVTKNEAINYFLFTVFKNCEGILYRNRIF
jgi:hypothetical protein